MKHKDIFHYTHGTPPENQGYFHLTYAWSKSGANIYVNGKSETILDYAYNFGYEEFQTNQGTLQLGKLGQSAEMTFNEIQIFDITLTAEEIEELTKGKGFFNPVEILSNPLFKYLCIVVLKPASMFTP